MNKPYKVGLVFQCPINEINLTHYNHLTYPSYILKLIEKSMSDLGQRVPIAIFPNGDLIDGVQRYTCAKNLGWKTILVRVIQFFDLEELKPFLQKNNQ